MRLYLVYSLKSWSLTSHSHCYSTSVQVNGLIVINERPLSCLSEFKAEAELLGESLQKLPGDSLKVLMTHKSHVNKLLGRPLVRLFEWGIYIKLYFPLIPFIYVYDVHLRDDIDLKQK